MRFLIRLARLAWTLVWGVVRRVVFAAFVLALWQLVPVVHRDYAERFVLRPAAERVQAEVATLVGYVHAAPARAPAQTSSASLVPAPAPLAPERLDTDSRALRARIRSVRAALEASAGVGR